jgi:hypothetical protein
MKICGIYLWRQDDKLILVIFIGYTMPLIPYYLLL